MGKIGIFKWEEGSEGYTKDYGSKREEETHRGETIIDSNNEGENGKNGSTLTGAGGRRLRQREREER